MARRIRSESSSARSRLLFWILGGMVVFFVLAMFLGTAWFQSFLRSDRFRELIGRATSRVLKAEGSFAAMHSSGTTIYADGFTGSGTERAFFSRLELELIRADLSLSGLLQRAWKVDSVEVQRMRLALDGPRLPAPTPAPSTGRVASEPGAPRPGWLPDHVDLRKAVIHDTNVSWGSAPERTGKVTGASLTLTPAGTGWNLLAHGGTVSQTGAPGFEIDEVRLRYQSPSLFITNADLKNNGSGRLNITGEVNPERAADLQLRFEGINADPFLPADWQKKLSGKMYGEIDAHAPMPGGSPVELSGTAGLREAQLMALPILDQIAVFTRTQQFRRINFTQVNGTFTHAGSRTVVKDFVAESEGLLSVRGSFIIDAGIIDGNFEVGVTPASLQWIPGSQERVFTVSRGGYLWTPMRVTGPLARPSEDLTGRLASAAAGALLEGVEGATQETKRKLLDFVSPFFQ